LRNLWKPVGVSLIFGALAAVAVLSVGFAVGEILFFTHKIGDEAAAWYGLNFLLPALICALLVFLYQLKRRTKLRL
jgi:hypothetical protein